VDARKQPLDAALDPLQPQGAFTSCADPSTW